MSSFLACRIRQPDISRNFWQPALIVYVEHLAVGGDVDVHLQPDHSEGFADGVLRR